MRPTAGSAAPDFTAFDSDGTQVELRGLRGRPVVLHFFVLAWTGL